LPALDRKTHVVLIIEFEIDEAVFETGSVFITKCITICELIPIICGGLAIYGHLSLLFFLRRTV
jgi:hypothetical protein